MTKKEKELLLKEKQEKASLRRNMIDSLESYWKDVAATLRVAKINNETDKLTYGNDLTKEEKDRLFNRYELLTDLNDNQIKILRTLVHNDRDRYESRKAKETLPSDAVWIDDIIWNEQELDDYLELFKRIGIEKIYYTNASTGALEVITWLTNRDIKIIGVTKISEYHDGLIFQI